MSHTELSNYPTDLTDEQWQILRKLLPQRSSSRGAPQTVCRRAVSNAILYVLRSGCPWRLLPREFPKWKTVYGIFLRWRNDGIWQKNSRYAPGHASVLLGAQEIPQCGDHRQSNHQNDGGRWPAGLRCWKEDQRTQTPYRCRHTWPDTGDRCPSGG